jgi:hypothetical protein
VNGVIQDASAGMQVGLHERKAYRCLERHHDVSTEIHILEHAFQLVGELAAALCLQFGDHVLFCICAGTASQQQPLGQILLVEGLKHILALQKHNARLRSYASDAIGGRVCGASTNVQHQLC